MHVVEGFGREREEIAKFSSALQAVEDEQQQIFWKVSIFTPVIGLLTQFNVVVLPAYGGWLVTQDRLALGTGLVVFAGFAHAIRQSGRRSPYHQQRPAKPERRDACSATAPVEIKARRTQ